MKMLAQLAKKNPLGILFLQKIDNHKHIDRAGIKKYFFNTGWMFFARITLMVINFFVGAYLARYLGPSAFGMYNYVISFVGLFSFISGLGINAILGREILLKPEKKDEIITASIYIHILTALLAICVINITAFFVEHDSRSRLLIGLFSLSFIFHASGVFPVLLETKVKAKTNAIIQIGTTTLSALMKGLGFYFGFGLLWFVALFVFDAVTSTLWYITVFKKEHNSFRFIWNTYTAKKLIKDSLPFMLSIIAASIYFKIDQVIITKMLGVERTGVYSVAVKLTEAWYFIPSLICASVFPAIVNAKKISHDKYISRIKSLVWFMTGLGAVIAVPLYFIAPYIIHILFGPLYKDAISPFQVYVWSSIASFVMPAISIYITTENKGGTLLISTILGACVNITLNIIFIPSLRITGSALATLISYSLTTLFLLLFFIKALKKKS